MAFVKQKQITYRFTTGKNEKEYSRHVTYCKVTQNETPINITRMNASLTRIFTDSALLFIASKLLQNISFSAKCALRSLLNVIILL